MIASVSNIEMVFFVLLVFAGAVFMVWFVCWNVKMCRIVESVENMSDEELDRALRREGI